MLQVVLVRHRAGKGLAWENFSGVLSSFSFMIFINNILLVYELVLVVGP